ncbi:hypothetical protein BSKO_00404 [Bryopsis sp. KO-2023]|nr:hypothetical protein BSKO_00404 [Bryopsis sp. KO-2023]
MLASFANVGAGTVAPRGWKRSEVCCARQSNFKQKKSRKSDVERLRHFSTGNPGRSMKAHTPGDHFIEDGSVVVHDDLDALLQVLPEDITDPLVNHPKRASLIEVVLDLGRKPEARFAFERGGEYLRDREISREDLEKAEHAVGQFGRDNRAGIPRTLHRISAIRNRKGVTIGLTCRVGRAVVGHIDMIRDLLEGEPQSMLFLGPPGVGKTTVIREMARVLSDGLRKRVVVVDTSNEIGGDGDVPHAAIGSARRMQVSDPTKQHHVMIEAVENHMPQVVIVDEIGTEAEALACRTIAERGVTLVATAHGQLLENLIKNPTLSDLIGGVETVTLGDDAARARRTQKTVLERRAPPTFSIVIEMRDRSFWVTHWVEESVDSLLLANCPLVQVRRRDPTDKRVIVEEVKYDTCDSLESFAEASNQGAASSGVGDFMEAYQDVNNFNEIEDFPFPSEPQGYSMNGSSHQGGKRGKGKK